MPPSVLIIGGGITGLAAGCFARMSGCPAEVLEMHTIPGGVCTAWKRQGFTADLCIHWLTGSKPGSSLYQIYKDIGLVRDQEIITHPYYTKVADADGHTLTVYNTPEKLLGEMVSLSPGDEAFSKALCKDIAKLATMNVPVDMGILDVIRYIPLLRVMKRYAPPISEVLAPIKDPVLQRLLSAGLEWHNQSALFSLIGLSLQGAGNGGYPIGGSLALAKGVEERFRSLGGTVRYRSKVETVITRDDRAVGVRLSDGTEVMADTVISAADGHATIFEMLGGKYVGDTIRDMYQKMQPFPPLVYVSLGIDADLSDRPHQLIALLQEPVMIGGVVQNDLILHNHSYDRTMAPEGKSVITLAIPASWEYWEKIPYQGPEYQKEKDLIQELVSGLVVSQYPECEGRIVMADVATPMTLTRYTGNWKGSYEGWLVTRDTLFTELPKTLPGLSGFYMAGQWVAAGGGIPGCVLSARKAVQQLCKDHKQPFCKAR